MSKADNGTEYVFFMPDGTERYEIVFERKEAFQFQKMHKAKGFMPLSRWENLTEERKRVVSNPRTFEVFGNYGTLTVDYDTGAVLAYAWEDSDAESAEDGYADILCIDVQEVHEANLQSFYPPYTPFDVVHVGYWTKNGDYVARCADPLTGEADPAPGEPRPPFTYIKRDAKGEPIYEDEQAPQPGYNVACDCVLDVVAGAHLSRLDGAL